MEQIPIAQPVQDETPTTYVAVDKAELARLAKEKVSAAYKDVAEKLAKLAEENERAKHAKEMHFLEQRQQLMLKSQREENDRKQAEWEAKNPSAAAAQRLAEHESRLHLAEEQHFKGLQELRLQNEKKEKELRLQTEKQKEESRLQNEKKEKEAHIKLMLDPIYQREYKDSVKMAAYVLGGISIGLMLFANL